MILGGIPVFINPEEKAEISQGKKDEVQVRNGLFIF